MSEGADMSDGADLGDGQPDMAPLVLSDSIEGPAQKGPFLEGSTVSAWTLDSAGAPTGEPINGTVTAAGAYRLESLTEGPTWVEIEGDVYDEMADEDYGETFVLNAAILPVDGRITAVNLLTDVVAHRVATLMGGGSEFRAAHAQAVSEMSLIWGIDVAPEELDFLGGPADDNDDVNWLLYSAAAMEWEVTPDDWTEVRDDFADDGLLDGDGLDVHESIVETLLDDPVYLLETAVENLEANYRRPPAVPDDFALLYSGCIAKKISDPSAVICGSDTATFDGKAPDPHFIEFYPETPGLYGAVIFHSGCTDGTYNLQGTTGGLAAGSFTELLLETRSTTAQAPYMWSVTTSCEQVEVQAIRYTDGTAGEPLQLRPGVEFRDGRGSNNISIAPRSAYYFVENLPNGEVFLSQYTWGVSNNGGRVEVYSADEGYMGTPIAVGEPESAAGFTLPFMNAGSTTYIRVINGGQTAPLTYSTWFIEVR